MDVLINRKNIITILLVLALIVIIYFSANRTQHGDPVKWMKDHGTVTQRRGDPDRFCLDCHYKKFKQTKENFCNKCHRQSNVKLIE